MDSLLDLLTPQGNNSNYSTIADLRTLQFTTAPAKPLAVPWQRFLTVEGLQLPVLKFLATAARAKLSSAVKPQI
jgi:hypothetical protein